VVIGERAAETLKAKHKLSFLVEAVRLYTAAEGREHVMSRSSNLDYLRKVLSGTLSATNQSPFNFPFPIMETLGFRLVEVGEGTASK
jgi:hypothetical protein